jgi:phosphoserine phosphatase
MKKTWRRLGNAMVKHYQGDNSDLKQLIASLQQAFGGMAVDAFERAADEFIRSAQHPTLARSYQECIYQPMIELMRYLEANGFTNNIASGGDRDFMRAYAKPLYGIPPECVIASSFGLSYREDGEGGAVPYKAELDVFGDGPEKPIRIWSRIGRHPLIAVGNSNGDVPMLRFAGGPSLPALRLLLLHDDAAREFDYVGGAEVALDKAHTHGWTVVSIQRDWADVFPAEKP